MTLRERCLIAVLAFVSSGYVACGGGGSDGGGALQRALESAGFRTISATSSDVRRPLIVVGGLTDTEGIDQGFSDVFECRGSPFDAVFLFDTRRDPASLSPVAESIGALSAGLGEAAAGGATNVTVLGVNTGGLVARAALSASSSSLPTIDLITLFSPFSGLDNAQFRSGYPEDFRQSSSFISAPAPLPGNVSHKKVNAAYSEPDTLASFGSPDAVFISPQANPTVDGDSRLSANVTIDIRHWPFTTPQRMQEALDVLGFSPNECPDSAPEIASITVDQLAALQSGLSQRRLRVFPKNGGQEVQLDPIEFASQGLEIRGSNGVVDTGRPFVIIVHGQDPQYGQYNVLESQLVAQGYEVFRFVYTAEGAVNLDLGELGEESRKTKKDLFALGESLSQVTKLLSERTGVTTINVLGHSNGGNIARYAMSQRDGETLAGSGLTLNLVTFATPADGVDSLVGTSGALARFGLKVFGSLGGEFYLPLTNQAFTQSPLGTNVLHRVVVTDESSFGDDYIVSVVGQTPLKITSDPQFVSAEDLGGGVFTDSPIQAGHSGVLQTATTVDYLIANLEALRTLHGDDVSADPPPATPAPTSTPKPGGSGGGSDNDDDDDHDDDDDDADPTPTPTATPVPSPSPSPTPDLRGAYFCPDGNYTPNGSGCGLGSFALTESGSSLVLDNFGSNPQLVFSITSTTLAQGSGIVIFNVPDHGCSITCLDADAGTARVSCSNNFGGQCDQLFGN